MWGKNVNELSLAQILACLCLLFADYSLPLCQQNKSTNAEKEKFHKEDIVARGHYRRACHGRGNATSSARIAEAHSNKKRPGRGAFIEFLRGISIRCLFSWHYHRPIVPVDGGGNLRGEVIPVCPIIRAVGIFKVNPPRVVTLKPCHAIDHPVSLY